MTREEHKQWHEEHYACLQALTKDFVYHNKELVDQEANAEDLFNWAYKQTINPTETREEALDE
jgi:hypothetical protein